MMFYRTEPSRKGQDSKRKRKNREGGMLSSAAKPMFLYYLQFLMRLFNLFSFFFTFVFFKKKISEGEESSGFHEPT